MLNCWYRDSAFALLVMRLDVLFFRKAVMENSASGLGASSESEVGPGLPNFGIRLPSVATGLKGGCRR